MIRKMTIVETVYGNAPLQQPDGKEHAARAFASILKQITPAYQRKILTLLARNKERTFTNIEISRTLVEDRSNIWRLLNKIIAEGGEHALVSRNKDHRRVTYVWKEPPIRIGNHHLSDILVTLDVTAAATAAPHSDPLQPKQ